MQGLIDVRHQLDRYAAPEIVEWHFASVTNRWAKRALTAAGFGYLSTEHVKARAHWSPVYSYAAVEGAGPIYNEKAADLETGDAIERAGAKSTGYPSKVAPVLGLNRPFFHVDVAAAVEAAIAGVETKLAHTSSGSSGVAGEAELVSPSKV